MPEPQHSQLLREIESLLSSSKSKISTKIREQQEFIIKLSDGLKTWYKGADDTEVVKHSIGKIKQDILSLEKMLDSPYFFMAEVQFDGQEQTNQIYISKYSFPEQKIYSWVSPVARLRFSNLGQTGYTLPSGKVRETMINRKDKYLIRDGELFEFIYESGSTGKVTILHKPWQGQDHFGLSEIIEKLDAYQDDIIRISPYGSMLISGAAGSGKTTLALHRIAFLVQNPETSRNFSSAKILIFVQDESTKSYFGSILPGLGLKAATITTFAEWALEKLGIKPEDYMHDMANPDYQLLCFAKNRALENPRKQFLDSLDLYEQLESVYFDYLDERTYEVYKQQKQKHKFDRFDLTLLLGHKLNRTKIKDNYRLILVDEAENYLAQQLNIIKQFISPATRSIMYIGDLVQQTFLCTIKSWEEIGERFFKDKQIVIPHVYRFTSQIRDYLVKKGYQQDRDLALRDGPQVLEFINLTLEQIAASITKQLQSQHPGIIGILSNNEAVLKQLKQTVDTDQKIHFLTIHQAQGVEFDTNFLVFKQHQAEAGQIPEALRIEVEKVERDLFLVGVTRAKQRLCVYSGVKGTEI